MANFYFKSCAEAAYNTRPHGIITSKTVVLSAPANLSHGALVSF